jgi:carbonic anhydrase/acetyltransferase-like protein (isoleucine patch superfamily)
MQQGVVVPYSGKNPGFDEDVFVAQGAVVIGDVRIGSHSSVWFNTVVRGDVHPIRIGRYTNIQDNATVHVMYNHSTIIGDYVTVGHNAVVHACTVGNNCLIGMGAIILSYSEIGENSIIAAGALITEHKVIPPNSLVIGSPGKVVRALTAQEIAGLRKSAESYSEHAQEYMSYYNAVSR